MEIDTLHESSFRDPSGYVFKDEKVIRRVIKPIYFKQYQALKTSGFFETLIKKKLLINHVETNVESNKIIITPEQIPFITYPYEWTFKQYQEAALLTLQIHKYALSKNFILKDASSYNITFHKGRPIFIDSLSFDFYEKDTPWRAYKQFIMHFLGPLLLAKYHGTDVFKLMQNHIDGIPLSFITSLLPKKAIVNPTVYSNIYLLAKMENKYSEDYKGEVKAKGLSKKAQINIIENLFNFIKKLSLKQETEWGEYYDKTNYNKGAFEFKRNLINEWVSALSPKKLIDIGGNDGTFTRQLTQKIAHIIVTDLDSNAIEKCYLENRKDKDLNRLAFVSNIIEPSPGIGFANMERLSLLDRFKEYAPEVTLALALIHHITLSGNIPFTKSAKLFSGFCSFLIIEFPKREDSWVASLLNRKREFINHFDSYNIDNFEESYSKYFTIVKKEKISETDRVLYLLKKKQ